MMRMKIAAAMAALTLIAAPASAQTSDAFAGTWAFQTSPYGSDQFGVVMSGVMVATPAAPNRYDIRLMAQELIIQRATGQSQTIVARQNCTGENSDGQFTISCQMAEPIEGYEPDNFLLQPGESDQLVGVLQSNINAQATFTRMR